jgi:AraC-like DNA-binding protein
LENINLNGLIKKCGMSKRSFLRYWKEIFEIPPGRFVCNLKIKQAQKMLLETDDRIYEIASALSFKDSFYFSRMFKKHSGLSPLQYKNKYRQD